MGYERVKDPPEILYHYTRRENVKSILRDGRIRRMGDTECWFCASLENTLSLMERTVMREGQPYIKVGGTMGYYPNFMPEDYVILKLTRRYQNGEWVRWNQEVPPSSPQRVVEEAHAFSGLKLGFRGDLKFRDPEIFEVAPLLEVSRQGPAMSM